MGGACVGCGSLEQIEIHHVRKLKDLNPKLSGIEKNNGHAQKETDPSLRQLPL